MDEDDGPPELVEGGSSNAIIANAEPHDSGKKVPITIVTEFGDSTAIEKQITVSQDSTSVSEWVSLSNGCICCSVKDSGVNAIEQLMERRGLFDHILLETTGLADPGNIAPVFWVDDGLGSSVYLDGIVTVVDAKNILRELEEPAQEERADNVDGADHEGHVHAAGPVMTIAHLQISHADVIILNKTDLVSEFSLEMIISRIHSINGLAKIITTTHSAVPQLEGTLLDLHAYDGQSVIPDFTAHGHSHLDPSISTRSLPLPVFDLHQLHLLEDWLQNLLWDDGGEEEKGHEIHRLKGYVALTDGTARIVQGVREIFEIVDAKRLTTESGSDEEGKIVLIGKDLQNVILKIVM